MVCRCYCNKSFYAGANRNFCAWAFGVVTFSGLSLLPQELSAADQLETLKVISATRTEKALEDVPVRMEVVTREHIEKVHARDLKQALKDVSGLMLKEIHGKSGYGVWMQGFDSERVLVLVDGEPVSASTGSTVDLTQIATADIERVEVVKGATSSLYGSSAMGGVINVITRSSTKPRDWSFAIDGGTYDDKEAAGASAVGMRHAKGHFSLNEGKWSAKATGSLRESDGFDLTPGTFATQGDEGHKANLSLRFGYKPSDDAELYIAPAYYDEDLQKSIATPAPGTPLGEIRKYKIEDASRSQLNLGGRFDIGESRLTVRGYLEEFKDFTEQDVIATERIDQYRDAEIDTRKAELQWDQPLGEKHYLSTGVVFFRESLSQVQRAWHGTAFTFSEEIGDGSSRNSREFFIQDDVQLSESNDLVVGARYQNDSDFGSHFAPSLNFMHTRELADGRKAKLRAGVGAGYRVPNLKERYFVFDHSGLGYMVFGNPDLEPESSTSYQLGLELIGGRHNLDIGVFYNDIEKLIETDLRDEQDRPNVVQHEYTNVDEATTKGVELRYGARITDGFGMSVSYSWLNSEDKRTGNTLPDRPEHQIKAGLEYELPFWNADISLLGTYQSEEFVELDNIRKSPSWQTWDLKFNKHFSKRIHAYVGIDNLFDKHRTVFDGFDQSHLEPRLVYIGLRINS